MKIGEYEQMMAYLTRPGFKDGTEKIVEPPKSMQMDTTTSNPIPEYDINDFRNDAEIYVLMLHNNTIPKGDIADKLNAFAQKGIDAGTFTMQEAADAVKDLQLYVKDRAQKQRLRDVVPEGIGTVDRKEFYEGKFVKSNPEGEQYVVKFPGKTNAIGYPNNFIGTQKFATQELMKKAIDDRKKFTEAKIKTKVNPEKILGEKTLKFLVDDTFKKGDFENFKQKVTESQKKSAEKAGKTRMDTGGKVPQQYLAKFNKAIEAGPGSDLFNDLIKITGRTKEELLELDAKRPKGKVDPKLRSQRAREFGGVDRRLTDEELKEKGKLYKKQRAEKEAVGTKYASSEDMARFNTVTQQKEDLNRFFIDNPDAINNTEFGKKIKALMETRLDKDGNVIRRKTDSKGNPLDNNYYKKLAKNGKIFDTFDINKIALGQRSTKFATNLNITPSQFNSGFIEGQVDRFFGIDPKTGKKGKFFGDTEKLKKVSNFLKSVGVRYDIPGVGRIGAEMGVAYDSKTGKFPHIYRTLKNMDIPDNLLLKVNPQSNISGMSLGAAGNIPMAKEILEKDFEKLKKIFGSKAARQIASNAIAVPGLSALFELPFISEYQDLGYSPKEIATQLLTGGLGVPFKDIQEKGKFVKEKGLGEALQSALRRQMIPQSIRPAMNLPADFGAPQELTPSEKQAMEIFGGEAQDVIDARRKIQADEYKRLQEMTDFDDPMFRVGAMGGGIMRLGFSVGGLASLFKKAAQVSNALRRVKNATFEMFNNVRMFGDQKGIEKNLQGFTNIPERNRKISSLEDIQELKANVPEKYHQDLDIMMKSIEQNNFETAFKQYKKFEKDLDPSLKFENIPQEYFPMVDPLNDAFVITGPRERFSFPRYSFRTSMELDPKTKKPTGKYQTEKLEIFDPETKTFRKKGEEKIVGVTTDKGKEGLN